MANKSVFFINCGIHAREWIAISTCVYVAREVKLYKHNIIIIKTELCHWIMILHSFDWLSDPRIFNNYSPKAGGE